MCKAAGTTLVELLAALAIVAVLATMAAPSFQTLYWDGRRTAAVNGFLHTVFLARSEAIKRARIVSVCPSSDAEHCGPGADWSTGWIVFENQDGDEPAVRAAGEPLIFTSAGWPGVSITSNRRAYSFRPVTQGVVNGTVVFCDARGAAQARAIIISHTGRPRVAQRDAAGKPLRCPSG
jgi:type IV fimbrial biogenesis protein FimT